MVELHAPTHRLLTKASISAFTKCELSLESPNTSIVFIFVKCNFEIGFVKAKYYKVLSALIVSSH